LSNNYIVSRYMCQEYFGESRSVTGSHPATGANRPQPHVSRAILRIQYTRQPGVFRAFALHREPGVHGALRLHLIGPRNFRLPGDGGPPASYTLLLPAKPRNSDYGSLIGTMQGVSKFSVCLTGQLFQAPFVSLSAWSEPRPVQVKAPCSQCWVDCGWEAARRASSTAQDGIS
jgi:hypothetical protein